MSRAPGRTGEATCPRLWVPESLGCELQAGKRGRGVPRVLRQLVMTHVLFWADFLPGCL